MRLYPSALAFFAMLFATSVLAWEPTPGKPYNGKTVKALIVKSSQFEAHEARMSAFEEETGINMIIDYVPFPNMKEALTAEMIAGGGDYDVVSIMDGWVSSLENLIDPIDDGIKAQGTDLADFPAAHLRHGYIDGKLNGLQEILLDIVF